MKIWPEPEFLFKWTSIYCVPTRFKNVLPGLCLASVLIVSLPLLNESSILSRFLLYFFGENIIETVCPNQILIPSYTPG